MPWSLRMVLYASIVIILILPYFGFRYFRCLNFSRVPYKRVFSVFFFVMAGSFLAYPVAGWMEYLIKGTFNRSGYPYIMLYLFWYGLVYTGTMLNWLVLYDLLLLVYKRVSGRSEDLLKTRFAQGFLLLSFITLMFTAAKMVWDTHRITTEEMYYSIPDDSDVADPLTIVHISDLHADSFTDEAKMDRYIRRVNQFEPDLVLFTGDLITSGTDHIQSGADALANINATYGTFAVLGDHDYWTGPEHIIPILEDAGIPVLQNETRWIRHYETGIKITGVTELYSSRVPSDTLEALLHESRDEDLKILFSHQATDRLIHSFTTTGGHFLLAGHTHGGQIRIPVFFYPLTAVRTETKFVNGHWFFDDLLLNINNGLGFTLSPVRYHTPAQVSVIRVQPETHSGS